jgi:uncharacterized protein
VSPARDARARTRTAPGAPARPVPKKRKGCPICGKPVSEDVRPFCSKRCADVDLGRWLGGRYAVPGEPVDPEGVSETEQED